MDHSVQAGVFAEWTVFDGYKIQTNYQRLQELRRQSEIQTRIALEDYVGELATEYYNFVQQRLRMRNLTHAVALSAERLRIVQDVHAVEVYVNGGEATMLIEHRSDLFLNHAECAGAEIAAWPLENIWG